jgi:hypothetical protein
MVGSKKFQMPKAKSQTNGQIRKPLKTPVAGGATDCFAFFPTLSLAFGF